MVREYTRRDLARQNLIKYLSQTTHINLRTWKVVKCRAMLNAFVKLDHLPIIYRHHIIKQSAPGREQVFACFCAYIHTNRFVLYENNISLTIQWHFINSTSAILKYRYKHFKENISIARDGPTVYFYQISICILEVIVFSFPYNIHNKAAFNFIVTTFLWVCMWCTGIC